MRLMTPIFRGSVQNGKLHLGDRDAFDRHAATLEGKPVVVTLKQWRKTRTNPQNAFFHAGILPVIAAAAEHTPAEVKDALKFKFLMTYDQSGFPVVKRTRDLDTKQFGEFIDQCVQFALDFYGIRIPGPDSAVLPEHDYEEDAA